MLIHCLPVGPLQANCYILGCEQTHKAAVIDPGGDVDKILLALAKEKLNLTAIINTHGHFDHVAGNQPLKKATGAELMIHELDAPRLKEAHQTAAQWGIKVEPCPEPDRLLSDGDIINIGKISLTVLHTPGHSPGGICLSTDNVAFVGDTLFDGSVGRTDFPGGDHYTLITSIQDKLFTLPDTVTVLPGHMTKTTIGREKKFNPFFNGIG